MEFISQILYEFKKDNCTTLAAALSYYTVFALPPLLYLIVLTISLCMSLYMEEENASSNARDTVERQVATVIGNQQISEEIGSLLQNTKADGGVWWKTAVSFIGIVIGATGVVSALQQSLNQVWEIRPNPDKSGMLDVLRKRLFSLGMILALAFLLLISFTISTIVVGFSVQVGNLIGMAGPLASIINFVFQVVIIFVVFTTLFRYIPDAIIQWRDVYVGAALTTVLFLIGRYALQVYFYLNEPASQFGSATASLAAVFVWIYYTANIVLLGAEATQTFAVRFGSGILPAPNADRVAMTIKRN